MRRSNHETANKRSTFEQCRDAFARVPRLETALGDSLANTSAVDAKNARLAREIEDLENNYNADKTETRKEINELRALVLDLARIAAKRSKFCLIC